MRHCGGGGRVQVATLAPEHVDLRLESIHLLGLQLGEHDQLAPFLRLARLGGARVRRVHALLALIERPLQPLLGVGQIRHALEQVGVVLGGLVQPDLVPEDLFLWAEERVCREEGRRRGRGRME